MSAHPANEGAPGFLDFVPPDRWQRLQDHFAEVLGVGLRTVDVSRTLLTNPSWPFGLYADRIVDAFRLGQELEELFPANGAPQEPTTITQPTGVSFSAMPLVAPDRRVAAYFVVGPVVLGRREEEGAFRERMTALGRDPEALWSWLLTIRLYSFGAFKSVLGLLEDVGNLFIAMAYQGQALQAMASPVVDPAMMEYHTNRLFESLLDAARAATSAEGGSVMVYDASQQAFKIRASQGLSDTIVASTRMRSGEGIAGMAVKRNTILLVDDKTSDDALRLRMQRKHLSSSLVAPLNSDEAIADPIGVLSLRTSNTSRPFTQEHVDLLRRLMNLAGVALATMRFAFSSGRKP